ncbi:twin-arginine translocase TatA/TatE family subunit [Helicobacter jaachi]|uniref:Sec-independent protein translocase protein TatA n=1 Tax=Helicobacter jaachi TaxID=1677920 RepID=A0A4U8TBI9_9HELI|nr:twin-arginine translocase TatA/TatE family subunit [Helicobacter jaachi]TLD97300.1 twin-arginine translocase TatA/TatE family subunit [Helicobacter jaachi]
MGAFSVWHWVIVLVVVLLLFGGKKIPELAKGLGSGIKNFKKAVKEDDEEEAKKEPEASSQIKQTHAEQAKPQADSTKQD